MSKILLITILILAPYFSFGQFGEEYKNRRIRSVDQITSLKDGVLFFRLRTKDVQVAYLRKYGEHLQADKIEKKRTDLNKRIINAFADKFDYCQVYFFYSKDSKHIRLAEFDSVTFLNAELKPDASIKPQPKYYCTAELGNVKADTARYYSGKYIREGEEGLEERERYYQGMNVNFKALVLKSDQFVQLAHPFPFYSRTYSANPNKKRMMAYVRRLNTDLHYCYKKVGK